MKEMLLAQQQASDQRAFYQSEVILEHLHPSQKLGLEAGLLERGNLMKPDARERIESVVETMGEEEV